MLDKIYFLSIKTKITLTIFMIILVFSMGIIFMITKSLNENINILAVNSAKDMIKINEAFVTKSLLEDDPWSIYKFLHSLTKINLIKSAVFIDINNLVVAHTNSSEYPIGKLYDIPQGEKFVTIKLMSKNVNLGKFILELDKIPLTLFFDNIKTHILFSILFATIISLFIGYFISKRILDRLAILSHNAKMIQKKNWKEIKPIVSKEIDEITIFQNSMEYILKQLNTSIENEKHLRNFYHDILESLDEFIMLCNNKYDVLYDNSHKLKKIILQNSIINDNILKNIQLNISQNNNNFIMDIERESEKIIYLFVIIKKINNSIAVAISDITPVKLLQEKQCFANSFEMIGEISSGVVHEIKNHLQPAKLLIDQENIDEEDKQRMISIIWKIDFLVNEFLKTGRPIDKLLAVDLDIEMQIDTILSILNKPIKDKKITIVTNIQKDIKAFMAVLDLETIMVNLLKNAIYESFEHGKIEINALKKDNYTLIEVVDFGKGIDKHILKDIHKPFFTTKGTKGSGIGLYTTYKIVYMYNGHIDIDSKNGKTIFGINIPQKG